jgi:hypothetical protein
MRSMVEGAFSGYSLSNVPSTTLRAVPLPLQGRIQ